MSPVDRQGGGLASGAIPAEWAGGWLTVDVDAIVANWRMLAATAAPAGCAAVVKADAYGLGIDPVAPALARAGCRVFFVAHLGEGVALRALLGAEPSIFVLNGVPPGTDGAFVASDLAPVLNSLAQVTGWRRHAALYGRDLPAALQIDTGMSRFGLSPDEIAAADAHRGGIDLRLVMSHLGCADTPSHPANDAQRRRFETLRRQLPEAPASLAASSGIFLGEGYQFDLVRPGAALYGVPPTTGRTNPMHPVVRLQARVVQIRDIQAGDWVGYGARFVAGRTSRIATLAVGYADGFLRACSGGIATLPCDGTALPIVGRISMDSLAVDATDLPKGRLREGDALDLIGPHRPLEAAAEAAGTIGYELLTGLGGRYHRVFRPGNSS